jgi:hypothetical protein
MAKPRYWQSAFPLAIISLCVAPQAFFLKNWMSCLEASISKLKVVSAFLMVPIARTLAGKNYADDGYERDLKVILDLLVSLPRICLYDNH